MRTNRMGHLEGLRGLACLQVLAMHAIGAFLPHLHTTSWAALWDGDSAVFVFFALSGHVLTPPFLRGIATPGRLVRGRIVRLALPGLLACLLGWTIARLCQGIPAEAGAALDSAWLVQNVPVAFTVPALLQDAVLNVFLLGYDGLSVLSPLNLWPDGTAFNPPLWTLSVELQGSLLVLALVRARAASPRAWTGAITVALCLAWRTPFLPFLAGHALALHRPAALPLAAAAAATALAVALDLPVLPALPADLLARSVAATLLFTAVLALPALHRPLATPLLQRLGAISFPIYLLHWPLLFGPGALAALAAISHGPTIAGLAGITTGLGLTALLAGPFAWIDRMALDWSRRIRTRAALAPG